MASLTINFTTANSTRIRAAFKTAYELDRTVSVDDIKGLVIRNLKQFVLEVERREARKAAEAVSEVSIT